MKLIDLTGQQFGELTVIERDNSKKKKVYWKCKCSCGNYASVLGDYLRSGHTKSCGCLRKIAARQIGQLNKEDLTGQRFGSLTVLYENGRDNNRHVIWHCKCICGKEINVSSPDLKSESTRSCGCQKQIERQITRMNKMIRQKFGLLTVIDIDNNNLRDSDNSYNYICQCECVNIKTINGVALRSGTTRSCGCINYSIGEQHIKEILDQNSYKYIKEYAVPELNYKRFDYAIIDENNTVIRLIEFDGIQHFKPANLLWETTCSFEERKKRDQEKDMYALSHNIPLVRIPYQMRDKITLDMLLGDEYLIT